MLPSCGGFSLELNGKTYKTITQHSAIGQELEGAVEGDDINVELKDGFKEYLIKKFFKPPAWIRFQSLKSFQVTHQF